MASARSASLKVENNRAACKFDSESNKEKDPIRLSDWVLSFMDNSIKLLPSNRNI